jgi:hypothetical protein
MAKSLRCRLGKHIWRSRTREGGPYYCEACGKTRDKPPPPKIEPPPTPPGSQPSSFGGGF